MLATVNLSLCVLAVLSYSRIGRLSETVVGVVGEVREAFDDPVQSFTRDGVTTPRLHGETLDDWYARHEEAARKFYKP